MSTVSTDEPGRTALRYTGAEAVSLPGNVNPRPRTVEPEGVVVVDEWAAAVLTADSPFVALTEDELKGAALDARLDELGLPKTGTADEKRARVAEAEALIAETGDPSVVATDDEPDPDDDNPEA